MSKIHSFIILFILIALVSHGQMYNESRHDLFEFSLVSIFDFSTYLHNNVRIYRVGNFDQSQVLNLKYYESLDYNFFLLEHISEKNWVNNNYDYRFQRDRINELKLANEKANHKLKTQKTIIRLLIILLIFSACLFLLARIQFRNFQSAYHRLFSKDLELFFSEQNSTNFTKGDDLKGSGLFIKDEEEIYLKIKELFEIEKIFLEKDISISKLAYEIGTNTSYLSSVINNRFSMSFKTLLNKFRIDEARKLLVSEAYSCYSIEGIANEVGYHSRSTFYQVFRMQTGLTPALYVKKHFNTKDCVGVQEAELELDRLTLN